MIAGGNRHAWWRWLLVPLASIAGALAAALLTGAAILAIMFWLVGFNDRSWLYLFALPAASGLVFGHLYIRIACRFAPTNKIRAGAVMTILLGMYCLLTVVLALVVSTVGPQLPSATLSASAAAVGTLWVTARRSRLGPNNSFKPNPLRGSA